MPRKVPPPGKKEQAAADAITAHQGSGWESLLGEQKVGARPDIMPVGPWSLACPDWRARMSSGAPLVPDLPLFDQSAARAVAIFDRLKLADVTGTPTLEDAVGDWFRAVVRALFGSLNPWTKARMIRELFLLVPKKNSKTTNGALLMLTALLLNERPNAPFIMTAPVQDVADIAFTAVEGAIALDPILQKKLHVRSHLKTIEHRVTGAELSIMTFDPSVLTGQKVAGALIDELHVSSKMSKASAAIRQIRGGMLPYPEGFMAFITTQSEEAPSGVFRAELMKARAIRDGKQKGAMLPVLYEFPEEVQRSKDKAWRDPATWHMVTPNAGRSITVARLEEEFDTALATGEAELREWASQHLNIEIGLALHSDRWAGAEHWEVQARPAFTLAELLSRCEVATVGIDGGGLDDLLGLAVIGRTSTGQWIAWTHGWAHPSVLTLRKSEAPKLRDFAADGDLTLVEHIGEDATELASLVRAVYDSGKMDRIGCDPHGVGAILDALMAAKIPEKERGPDGKDVEKIVGISQGWKMTGAIKTTERKLAEGVMIHAGTRFMNWVIGNAKVEPRGNAIIITKQASGTAKIDPLLALFNAAHLMALNPQPPVTAPQLLFL